MSMRNSVARVMGLSWSVFVLGIQCSRANIPGGGDSGPPVTVRATAKSVIFDNGILTATVQRSDATVTSLRYSGFEMANSIYYSMDGGDRYRVPSRCFCSVKSASPEMADISFKSSWHGQAQAFDIDIHYVLRRGATGLYSYAVLTHPANYPATSFGEWRAVWKLSDDLLEKIYVDDARHWLMPNSNDYRHAEPTPIKEITRFTTGVMAGQFDCKYNYAAEYWDLGCWGHASDKNDVGAWIVLGSHEYFNDGPTKQDLTAAAGINHLHFGLDHYNGSGVQVAAGEFWQKFYGPFLLYCNRQAAGADACWADARAQAQAEQNAWPYAWLNHPLYPRSWQRGAVSGHFVVRDALKPQLTGAGAWVGLAQPPTNGNWQFESMHYQFWTKADAQGNFLIPGVRPGAYKLYAFTTGAVGEFSQPDVTVVAGATNDVSQLLWAVPHHGRSLAWEIGVPDRTAREFHHGTDYFHDYLWNNFGREFPNPLEYTIGRSNPRDWNYVQTAYRIDGKVQSTPWVWRIHFNLTNVPPGAATMTMAIASAQYATINVFVNGERRPIAKVTPSIQGGDALLRQGIHAKYCVEYVSLPTSHFKIGENIISLSLENDSRPAAHVMYDYLNLEMP